MEISGKLIQILPAQIGTGKNGPWKKCDFVMETNDKFPKKVCISAWNELADQVEKLTTGAALNVSFDVSSREYNGRWYNDIKAWKVAIASATNSSSKSAESTVPPESTEGESDEGLPF